MTLPSVLFLMRSPVALLLACVLPIGTTPAGALEVFQSQTPSLPAAPSTSAQAKPPAAKITNDQLDSLVAPIALYPDPLLAQLLIATTYPLEIVQLQQWMDKNKHLKDKALVEAVQKKEWDASVQGLAVLPSVVKILSENVAWTADLGNAFLAQQKDVMDAVHPTRKPANDNGQLKSSNDQNFPTKAVENKTVLVMEPSSPDVAYAPSYHPAVVHGSPVYTYYPMSYPAGSY